MNLSFNKKPSTLFKRKPHGYEINPARDWWHLLAIFAILLIAVIGFNVYVFSQISRGQFFQATQPSTNSTEALDRSKLQSTESFYESRQQALIALEATQITH